MINDLWAEYWSAVEHRDWLYLSMIEQLIKTYQSDSSQTSSSPQVGHSWVNGCVLDPSR